MQDRIPGTPGQYLFKISTDELQKLMNAEECNVVLVRDDQPVVEGTPLSKATFLPDELAAELCPDVDDPTPADALRALQEDKLPKQPTQEEIANMIANVPIILSSEHYGPNLPAEATAGRLFFKKVT